MNEPRVFLRPVGNPVPLGFFALATGTLTLAAMQLGWVAAEEGKDVALVLVGLVFPLQMVATVFAFLARDAAAAEGLGLSGGGWLVLGLITLTSPSGSTSNALGVFLLALGACMAVSSIASASSKPLAAAVVAGIGLRFAVTGIYELTGSEAWENLAGIVGLALFLLAFCAGLALTFADARSSAEGEPGVRRKL